MIERKMDYRGSKSNTSVCNDKCSVFVKEQREDGSCRLNDKRLRCSLMGFARNYQIKILSNVLHKKEVRFYSTTQNKIHLNPWFLSGFIDGEGCFRISLTKVNRASGWRVQLFFQITLHTKDRVLLESVRDFFGVGKIQPSGLAPPFHRMEWWKGGKNLIQYRIQTFDELAILINHLENYPLITQKKADYELFKKAYGLMLKKEHLNIEGLKKIVSLKASLNLGLSVLLKEAFPGIVPAERFTNFSVSIPDCNWISGFASAEGCFMVGLAKSALYSTGGYPPSLYNFYYNSTYTWWTIDELFERLSWLW